MSIRFTHLSALALACAFTMGCSDKDKDKTDDTDITDTDDTGTATTSCYPKTLTDATSGTFPAAGATGVYTGTSFAIAFTGEAKGKATFKLNEGTKDAPGAEAALGSAEFTTSGTGDTATSVAVFLPSAPLKANTAYTLTIDVTCPDGSKPTTIGFTTDGTGSPVDDAATTLTGNAYSLDLAAANIVLPPGVGGLLGGLLGGLDTPIYIVLDEVDPDTTPPTFNLFGGIGISSGGTVTQDECSETFALDPVEAGATVTFNNPYFSIAAPDGIAINVEGMSIQLDSVILSGAFSSDASELVGVRLSGDADARKLAPALADKLDLGDADGLCGLLMTVGAACAPCADSTPYCLHLDALNLSGTKIAGGDSFTPITAADIAANSDCDED